MRNQEMSKRTASTGIVAPLLVGGLVIAATMVTAATLVRRWKDSESADSVFASCERTLALLDSRISTAA